jgi:hypothetical protein
MIESDSLTVQLCAAGMAVDGDPAAARRYFLRAWEARRDSYDACIAAHFLARHQPTPAEVLHWNELATAYAEAVPDNRAQPLLSSLYLNLGDSYLAVGRSADAARAAQRGLAALKHLPTDGYGAFVARALARLNARIANDQVPIDFTGPTP